MGHSARLHARSRARRDRSRARWRLCARAARLPSSLGGAWLRPVLPEHHGWTGPPVAGGAPPRLAAGPPTALNPLASTPPPAPAFLRISFLRSPSRRSAPPIIPPPPPPPAFTPLKSPDQPLFPP